MALPSLDGGALDLEALRADSRSELLGALDGIPRDAHGLSLVLDPTLSGPFGLLVEVREFTERGISDIYHLLPTASPPGGSRAYFIRPTVHATLLVAAHLRALARLRPPGDGMAPPLPCHLFYVPRASVVCERVLAEEGVMSDGSLVVNECPIHLFPHATDLLSLERPPSVFKEPYPTLAPPLPHPSTPYPHPTHTLPHPTHTLPHPATHPTHTLPTPYPHPTHTLSTPYRPTPGALCR